MPEPYAELIGDPIAHSLSPLIHDFWLQRLRISGSYRAVRVTPDDVSAYFEARHNDLDWRGCNVTAPLKTAALRFLCATDDSVDTVRAVNCIRPGFKGLFGANSDVDGVAEALADVDLAGRRGVIIGAGGAARAAALHLQRRGAAEIVLLVRDPDRVELPWPLLYRPVTRVATLDSAATALDGAAVAINATPLGMAHGPAMLRAILDSLPRLAPDGVAFDMIYAPLDTAFLAAARAAKLRTVDGLVMLVGQARFAFDIFFGAEPPRPGDLELRNRLISASSG